MSGEQIRLQVPPNCLQSTSWIAQMIRHWIPDCLSGKKKCMGPKSVATNSRNWQLMTSGRWQMQVIKNFWDWQALVGEVPQSSVAKTTTMDCTALAEE